MFLAGAKKIKEQYKKWLQSPNFFYVVQDVTTPFQSIRTPVDIIYHAASPISGAIINSSSVDIILPNIIGTRNCLDFMRCQQEAFGIRGRVVIFSSATIYANLTGNDRRVTETDTETTFPLESPAAPYFESKRLSEVLTSAYCRQYGIDAVIARLSYVYGYSYYPPDTAFYEFLKNAISGKHIVIKNSGIAKRDNIYNR